MVRFPRFTVVALCAIFTITALAGPVRSEPFERRRTVVHGDGSVGPYSLNARFIGGTVRVDRPPAVISGDYAFNVNSDEPDAGTVSFSGPVAVGDSAIVSFAVPPAWIPGTYRREAREDTLSYAVPYTDPPWRRTDPKPFPGLTFGGSKTFEVTAGGDRSASLNQTLRLNMSGNITDDVTLNAVVSDQNVPITPAGDTREINDLERVLIQLRGPAFSVDMGDTELTRDTGRWLRYSRRLTGARGSVTAKGVSVSAAGAVSEGTYRSTTIQPIEGNQGPYRLSDRDGRTDIAVIPGTERIWINGGLLERGLAADYIIAYETGEVVFTERRIIGSDMRIVADYEYASEQFRKSFYTGAGDASFWDGRVTVTAMAVREADDPDKPVFGELDDVSKRLLAQSGDSPAQVSGIRPASGDSTGTYDFADGRLVYNPGRDGRYNVTFSWAGEGEGAYRYRGGGVYEFVPEGNRGPDSGASWKPVTLIEGPRSHALAGATVTMTPFESLSLSGEFAGSSVDRNTLSGLDDGDNDGGAFRTTVAFSPAINPGVPLRLNMGGELHEQGSTFAPLDRDRPPEENRRWGLPLTASTTGEKRREYHAGGTVTEGLFTGSGIRFAGGSLTMGAGGDVRRNEVSLDITGGERATMQSTAARIRREDIAGMPDGTIDRLEGGAGFEAAGFTPNARWEAERAEGTGAYRHGAAYGELETTVTSPAFHGVTADVGWLYRLERAKAAAWRDSSLVRGGGAGLTADLGGGSVRARYSRRERSGGPVDTTTDQGLIEAAYRPADGPFSFDLAYRAGRERDATKRRNYIYTGAGSGAYRWEDDNGDGVREPAEFIPDEHGEYILFEETLDDYRPVNAVSLIGMAAVELPGAFIGRLSGLDVPVTSELSVELNEKSAAGARDVFLLNLSQFRKSGVTSSGDYRLQEDVTAPIGAAGSARLRILRSGLYDAEYVTGAERRSDGGENLRLRLPVGERWDSELTAAREVHDRVYDNGGSGSFRVRSVNGDAELSYHARPSLTFSLGGGGGRDRDNISGIVARYLTVEPGMIHRFSGRGRIEASYTLTDVTVTGTPFRDGVLPYTMARGRKDGRNHDINVTCDYRLSDRMNLVATYAGRRFAGRDFEHFATTQLRAVF